MSLTYTTYVSSLANLLVVPVNDVGFQTALPNIIDDAEQRLYRELDLLNTVCIDTGLLTANNRNFTLPTNVGTFLVINQINIITPSTATAPDAGTRNALTRVSKDYLDFVWPSVTGATVPVNYATVQQDTIIFGPWPDATYTAEVIGTQRPAPISSTNTTTLLSNYFPDLFIAGSMVFACGYQKNFSAMSDQPQSAITWEGHTQTLLRSALTEETRKKGGPWPIRQPSQNNPVASPEG